MKMALFERTYVGNGVEAKKTRLLTVSQAAERLNVKERYIRHLIAGGRVDIIKIGRLVRIPESAVEDLLTAGYRSALGE